MLANGISRLHWCFGGNSAPSPQPSAARPALKGEGAVLSDASVRRHPPTPNLTSSFPRTREPSGLGLGVSAPHRVCGDFLFRPLGRVPFVKRWKATPAKRNQKGLPRHTGPMEPGYPREFPRHGGPPRGYVPVARGALATSMSHDLLSAGFVRPSEGAFRSARRFLWKSKSKSERAFAFALRRSELAREPSSLWVIPLRASASAVRDGAASRVRGNDEGEMGVSG
ncbi:hypothetical protein J2T41_000425 [Pseudomonas citronellolis]|nr:hypothetical protein [Pseudomonas citronellolis]MCP1795536.1 hypothetical protein [Pseudomonas citronellolis]